MSKSKTLMTKTHFLVTMTLCIVGSLLWGIGEGGRWQDFSAGRQVSVDPTKKRKYSKVCKSGRIFWMGGYWFKILLQVIFCLDLARRKFECHWVSTELPCCYKQIKIMRKEGLGSDLQGEFSTIKLPLRLREKDSGGKMLFIAWRKLKMPSFSSCLCTPQLGALSNMAAPLGKNEDWGVYPQTHGQAPQLHPCQDREWRLLQLKSTVAKCKENTLKWDISARTETFCNSDRVFTSRPGSVEHQSPTRWDRL